jgi:guanine nucleotide-binding protein G(I)/G(S)/G(T) subunit beta-1
MNEKIVAFQEGAAREAVGGGGPDDGGRMSAVKCQRILQGHFGKVYACHWGGGSGEQQIISAAQDGKLIVWDSLSRNKLNAVPLKSSWVMTCAIERQNGKLVASGGLDNLCSIYSIASDTDQNSRPVSQLQEHDGYDFRARPHYY